MRTTISQTHTFATKSTLNFLLNTYLMNLTIV